MRGFTQAVALAVAWLPLALTAPAVPEPVSTVKRADSPNGYIVTLKEGLSRRDLDSHLNWVNEVHRRSLGRRDGHTSGVKKSYSLGDGSFHAYSGDFDAETLETIKGSSDVDVVEENKEWRAYKSYTSTTTCSEGPEPTGGDSGSDSELVTQYPATWGQGSISHMVGYGDEYVYHPDAGKGVYAYVIDSGVRITHVEFGGRATHGYNAIPDEDEEDYYGHGTHVAGTVAGEILGVAKKASVISVKALNATGYGTTDISMEAFTWAASDIIDKSRTGKAVINMSLGGPKSDAFNTLLQRAYAQGVVTVAAAGNADFAGGEGYDASLFSPASAPDAVTVGRIDPDLTQAYDSNYGEVLDCWAPGGLVLSAGIVNDTAVEVMSGTSQASPHVAGILLTLQSVYDSGAAESTVQMFKKLLNPGVIVNFDDKGGSPDLLAYNGSGE